AAPAGAAAPTTPTPANPADPQAAIIAASQKYYKAIAASLDALGPPASAGDGAAWLRRTSKRIETLPAANVDPELLTWGTGVSAELLCLAQQMATAQTQISARAAGAYATNTPNSTSSGGYYDDGWDGGQQVRADNERMVAARTEATQAERLRTTAPVAARL